MMPFFYRYILLLFLSMNWIEIYAQNNPNSSKTRKESINLELAGKSPILASLCYEYAVKPQFSLGAGLGVGLISNGEITRTNNGASETGKYLDAATSQLLYANYFIGKSKHKLLITGGVTHLLASSRNKYSSETERFFDSNFLPNVGLGYQLTGRRTLFRLTAYGLRLPEPSGWFPRNLPWGGISFGYRF